MFVISRFDIAGIFLPLEISMEMRDTDWNGDCKAKAIQLWAA